MIQRSILDAGSRIGQPVSHVQRIEPEDPTEDILAGFYRTARAGQARLSDGGGPFGFDVTVALLFDELVELFRCDAVCETGCFVGDTTEYLARRYRHLPIYSCDIRAEYAAIARHRTAAYPHVCVACGDSVTMVAEVCRQHGRPIFFLDAHWEAAWPLAAELATIIEAGSAVVVIHDFDVGHPRFSFDTYQGIACGPGLLAGLPAPPALYFVPDPDAAWRLPCLQVGRRAGVGVVVTGLDAAALRGHPRLLTRTLAGR